MTTKHAARRFAAVLAVLVAGAVAGAAPQLRISPNGYEITQVQAVSGSPGTYDVTARAGIVNRGDPAIAVTARLTSSSPDYLVLDGDLRFGDVPRTGRPVRSLDTFQLRVLVGVSRNAPALGRAVLTMLEALTWEISCANCGSNRPPVANAGPDQTVAVGQVVALNGGGSTDPDGQTLTYAWSFVSRPDGSTAALSSAATVNPTFLPDRQGDYIIRLIVNDGALDSAPDTVQISTRNSPPVANAGPDQQAFVGQPVALDGSASSDVDGDPLTYLWRVTSRPEGSTTEVIDPSQVKPTFTPDVAGTFLIELVVDDGTVSSTPDTMVIETTVANRRPTADAGADVTATVGAIVQLDGLGSNDADGDPLTYQWTLNSRPPNSSATLQGANALNPTLLIDQPGTYVVQLIVSDGMLDSDPDTISISTVNSPPVADPGSSREVRWKTTVQLDGSSSSDPDGDALGFAWSMLSRPPGSSAALADSTAVAPTFEADRPGLYVVQLIVNDATVNSVPASVSITATNEAPVAFDDAASTTTGTAVDIDVLANDSDGDGDALAIASVTQPANGTASITGTAIRYVPNAGFAGTDVFEYTVTDGVASDVAAVTIAVQAPNTAPIALLAITPSMVEAGSPATLDFSGSFDSDPGDAITNYVVTLLAAPLGSSGGGAGGQQFAVGVPLETTLTTLTFVPDIAGTYQFQLLVRDTRPASSVPVAAELQATLPSDEGVLRLNEIVFKPSSQQPAFIEVRNLGPGSARLRSFSLTNERNEVYRPPDGPVVPTNGIALIVFDGENRIDGLTIHSDAMGFLDPDDGSITLADATEAIQDQVTWGEHQLQTVTLNHGALGFDIAAGSAIARTRLVTTAGSRGWTLIPPSEVTPGTINGDAPVRILMPQTGAVVAPSAVALAWYPTVGASRYRVQVASDETFSSTVFERVVESADVITPPLSGGEYFWRVQAIVDDGRGASYSPAHALIVEAETEPALRSARDSTAGLATTSLTTLDGVPLLGQHKDTSLLLLESPNEFGQHSWHMDHAVLDPHDPADLVCIAAAIAIINRKLGGDLSQDRINFEVLKTVGEGPEGDLAYGPRGLSSDEATAALRFAVGGEPIPIPVTTEGDVERFWQDVKTQIDGDRPLLLAAPGTVMAHAYVLFGYSETDSVRRFFVVNPWVNGSATGKIEQYDLDRTADSVRRGNRFAYWVLPANATGVMQEPEVTLDSDGDGVMDFDEIRRFHTDPFDPDSDNDKVGDYADIRASKFDELYGYPGAVAAQRRLDWDGDGLPMELDRDSDDDGCTDGFEDANRNGVFEPTLGETYNFYEFDHGCKIEGTITSDGQMSVTTPGGVVTITGRTSAGVEFTLDPDLSDLGGFLRVYRPTTGHVTWHETVSSTFPCFGTGSGVYAVTPSDGLLMITGSTIVADAANFGQRFVTITCADGSSDTLAASFAYAWFSTQGFRPIKPPDSPGFPKTFEDQATGTEGNSTVTWSWKLIMK
jgi:hypothetical protein